MKNLGMIQGRLSLPVQHQIQAFPREAWRLEFYKKIHTAGLSHIEWIVTEECFRDNPLMVDGEDMDRFFSCNSHLIGAVCCDHLIHNRVGYGDKLDEFLEENLTPVCERVSKVGNLGIPRYRFNTIGIPLLDASSMEKTKDSLDAFKREIVKITDRFPDLLFSFEAELDHERLMSLVELRPNYRVTYDTGNLTSYGVDHQEYLQAVFPRIDNVHLKDRACRNRSWQTVFPGTGDTDFSLIFSVLKGLGYNGNFTLQTARGLDGLEMQTVKYHKLYFETLYDRVLPRNNKP